MNLLTKVIPSAPPTVLPIRHRSLAGEIVELPSSLLLLGRNGIRRAATANVLKTKMRKGLRRASLDRRVFHVWFHPSNFYADAQTQFDVLESCLLEARRLADAGEIDLRTMGSFGEREA